MGKPKMGPYALFVHEQVNKTIELDSTPHQ